MHKMKLILLVGALAAVIMTILWFTPRWTINKTSVDRFGGSESYDTAIYVSSNITYVGSQADWDNDNVYWSVSDVKSSSIVYSNGTVYGNGHDMDNSITRHMNLIPGEQRWSNIPHYYTQYTEVKRNIYGHKFYKRTNNDYRHTVAISDHSYALPIELDVNGVDPTSNMPWSGNYKMTPDGDRYKLTKIRK